MSNRQSGPVTAEQLIAAAAQMRQQSPPQAIAGGGWAIEAPPPPWEGSESGIQLRYVSTPDGTQTVGRVSSSPITPKKPIEKTTLDSRHVMSCVQGIAVAQFEKGFSKQAFLDFVDKLSRENPLDARENFLRHEAVHMLTSGHPAKEVVESLIYRKL